MDNWRPWARILLGAVVASHALAHAVLAYRGLLEYPPSSLSTAIAAAAFATAVIALFAAGVGLMWSRTIAPAVPRLMGIGILGSVVAQISSWDPSAWWGLSLDAVLTGTFAAAARHGVLARGPVRPGAWRRAARAGTEALAWSLVAYIGVAAVAWPWHRQWGTTATERARALPGDRAGRDHRFEVMHAVTIDAPRDAVWSWLVQIGQDRAGFYSYDWIERRFFADIRNVYEIRPEWQERAAGDFVRAAQPGYLGGIFGRDIGWHVSLVDPGHALVLDRWGAFVVEAVDERRTRFMIRSPIGGRETPAWGAGLTFALFEIPHFIMERKMMLTIKARAERGAGDLRVGRSTIP